MLTASLVVVAGVLSAAVGIRRVAVDLPGARRGAPSVEMPMETLTEIAANFDGGRNDIYCLYGQRQGVAHERILVDSVKTITTIDDCGGIGVGFVTRIADPVLLTYMLRGLMTSLTKFSVVSAFYQTEDVERGGKQLHVARALSVIRGPSIVKAAGAS